ncbi:hypothetical protein GCM10010182_28080 [Actinomadura cremea]|nr:hypothetical protein GCM10010182_28080 [Actinomadura cremea]
MPLAHITLGSGRVVELNTLNIHSTYEGLLGGYPNAQMNDALLNSLSKRRDFAYRTAPPVHVIRPPRTYPHPDARPSSFGPVEVLPPIYCRGHLESTRVNGELDDVLHRSWLDVVWFQDDIAAPAADFVTAAPADLRWDGLAEDYEL